jgi:hypothetical protein
MTDSDDVPLSDLSHLKETDDDDDVMISTDEIPYSYAKFHFVFVFAAMYASCLLTNWVAIEPGSFDGGSFTADQHAWSYWIKLSSAWGLQGLYFVSMLLPLCFQGFKMEGWF